MIRRLALLPALVLLPTCASLKKGGHEVKSEKQKIVNVSYFDVASCFPRQLELPEKITSEVLMGVQLHSQPMVMECLVDPKARGPEKKTAVAIESALTDAGVENKVSGQNLTADGERCIKDALDRWMATMPALNAKNGFAPAPPKGESPKPLSSQLKLEHVADVSPTVTMGVNEGSDYVGAIRLAQARWCECYAPWKETSPRQLTALIKIARPVKEKDKKEATAEAKKEDQAKAGPVLVHPAEIVFQPTQDAAADQVAACLKDKLMALDLPTPAGEFFTLPAFPFNHVHSWSKDPIPEAAPNVAFIQFDLLRGTRTAEAALAYGPRTVAVTAYDEAVKLYKEQAAMKRRPKNMVTVKELKDKCARLLEADDAITRALEQQLVVDQATHDFVVSLLAKDPQWAEAEAVSKEKVASAQKEVADSKQMRAQDAGACPREHY